MSARFERSLQKGEFGERIVRKWLENQGYVVYQPTTLGAHAFDVLAIKDKEKCIALDVKSKARRTKYPDTGISVKHYETYLAFSARHQIPFWVCFVDEFLKQVYGNSIERLDEPIKVEGLWYPMVAYGTRYWPVVPERMRVLHALTDEECASLKSLSQRSYDYVQPLIFEPSKMPNDCPF